MRRQQVEYGFLIMTGFHHGHRHRQFLEQDRVQLRNKGLVLESTMILLLLGGFKMRLILAQHGYLRK